jgi:DNA replication protein DnaC
VRQGVDVAFMTCSQLTASLNAARATGGYERRLANLARVPLLIIDSCGVPGNVELTVRQHSPPVAADST